MDELFGSLAFKKVPTVEIVKKRDSKEKKTTSESKRPKLLDDVLSGVNPPSFVPSHTTDGTILDCLKKEEYRSASHVLKHGRLNLRCSQMEKQFRIYYIGNVKGNQHILFQKTFQCIRR